MLRVVTVVLAGPWRGSLGNFSLLLLCLQSTVSTNNVGQINSNQLIAVSSFSSIMGDEFKSN